MNYLATRYEDDGEYVEQFEANSIEEAEKVCQRNGWLLDGEVVASFEYDPLMPPPSLEVH